MIGVHREHVIGRRRNEPIAIGEKQRVQAVDELRDGGGCYLVGVAVEGVERQPCQHGVAHRGLLTELVRGGQLRAGTVPRAPLVDDQLHLVRGIVHGHRGPVVGDERLHLVGLAEQLVPLLGRKRQRIALARVPVGRAALAHVPGVVVQRPPVQ